MTPPSNTPQEWRRLGFLSFVLVALGCMACGSATTTVAGTDRKWVGPVVNVPGGGQFRTVIYYGPWSCRAEQMRYCQAQCGGSGHALQGCMWLADLKMDFGGFVLNAGTRYAFTHCCCNYSALSPAATQAARSQWDNIRVNFRNRWAERFGAWPADANGMPWQGHHVHDLWHGGIPTDWNNILPMPDDIHRTLCRLYNQCYANGRPEYHPGWLPGSVPRPGVLPADRQVLFRVPGGSPVFQWTLVLVEVTSGVNRVPSHLESPPCP
jgi:hypothetical protein